MLMSQFTLARILVCPHFSREMAIRKLYAEYENLGLTLPANTSTSEL